MTTDVAAICALDLADVALLDRVGEAIVRAGCPSREGPYGGYDYGYNTDFYGEAPKGGRYVVRDCRDMRSPDWGRWVHQTDDRVEHEAAFQRLTRRHVAREALLAALQQNDEGASTPPTPNKDEAR
jgi:hypothetical protein